MLDIHGKEVVLPKVGTKVLRDGYVYTVLEVIPHRDLAIVASIDLRGEGGTASVGYYDFLRHEKLITLEQDSSTSPDGMKRCVTATEQKLLDELKKFFKWRKNITLKRMYGLGSKDYNRFIAYLSKL